MGKDILKRKILPIALIILAIICSKLAGGFNSGEEDSRSSSSLEDEASPSPDVPVSTSPEISPEAEEQKTFLISMIGDCTLGTVPGYEGSQYAYETIVGVDYAYPFAKTKQYFENDDLTFANFESCLTNSEDAVSKTFVFKADPDYAQVMKEGSVELVTLANNHINDFGEQGVKDTQEALQSVGVSSVGRDECLIYETEGRLKLGIYAGSFVETTQIQAGIQQLKDQGAQFTIAALHWGDEGSYSPNQTQISQAHAAIDAGADFVYGSHPHTLQPYEEYNGNYIYYSMGNWTFGGNTNPRDKDTFILQLTLERQDDGSVVVTERTHIPCASSGETGYNNYQPVPYEEDSDGYARVISKLDGTYSGDNLTIDYDYTTNE